jgi:hypothetical protein
VVVTCCPIKSRVSATWTFCYVDNESTTGVPVPGHHRISAIRGSVSVLLSRCTIHYQRNKCNYTRTNKRCCVQGVKSIFSFDNRLTLISPRIKLVLMMGLFNKLHPRLRSVDSTRFQNPQRPLLFLALHPSDTV